MTTRNLALILPLSLVAVACKDDIHALDAPPAPIDSPKMDAPTGDGAPASSLTIAAEGNFSGAGTLTTVDTNSHSTTENIQPGSVGDNPLIRVDTAAGFVYVINSNDGDNISQLDTATLTLQVQLSTGSGTNPQDLAAIGTKLYAATLQGSGLEVVDTSLGSAAFAGINLGAAVNAAAHKCSSVFAVGTNVYVACGLLNSSFNPTGNGLVLVVDSTTDTVTSSFNLTHPNPIGFFEVLPDGNLGIPTVDFATGSGCVEEVSTTGSGSSAGCLGGSALENPALGSGNYVNRLAVTADGKTVILNIESATPGFGAIAPFDIASSTLGSAISPTTEILGDVATCPNGDIAVSDIGSGSNGLRFYSKTAELTTAPIGIGIKPASSHGLFCY